MVELTKSWTSSKTVRSEAIDLLQFGKVNVKPVAEQVWGSGILYIMDIPMLRISSFVRRKFAPGEVSFVYMDEKKQFECPLCLTRLLLILTE